MTIKLYQIKVIINFDKLKSVGVFYMKYVLNYYSIRWQIFCWKCVLQKFAKNIKHLNFIDSKCDKSTIFEKKKKKQ